MGGGGGGDGGSGGGGGGDDDFATLDGWGDLSGSYAPSITPATSKKLASLLDKAVVLPGLSSSKKAKTQKRRSSDDAHVGRDVVVEDAGTGPKPASMDTHPETQTKITDNVFNKKLKFTATDNITSDVTLSLLAKAMPDRHTVRFNIPDEPSRQPDGDHISESKRFAKAKAAEAKEFGTLKSSKDIRMARKDKKRERDDADGAAGTLKAPAGVELESPSKALKSNKTKKMAAAGGTQAGSRTIASLWDGPLPKHSEASVGGASKEARAAKAPNKAPAGKASKETPADKASKERCADNASREAPTEKALEERLADRTQKGFCADKKGKVVNGGVTLPKKTRKEKLKEKRARERQAAGQTAPAMPRCEPAAAPVSKAEQEARVKAKLEARWKARQKASSGNTGIAPTSSAALQARNVADAAGGKARTVHDGLSPEAAGQKSRKTADEKGAGAPTGPKHVAQEAPTQPSSASKAAAACGRSKAVASQHAPRSALPAQPQPAPTAARPPAQSSVISKMMARLSGSRFRSLNEALYTCSGDGALQMMQDDPELFSHYHEGFREQTKGWPKQPVDIAIRWVGSLPASAQVADFGCGDARLAASVPQTVHSFDLVATAPGVIACNMAEVPLGDASVDAAVFSLALMGTDYGAFLVEAARVLKPKGWLWIAEVRSRFGGTENREDFRPFLACLSKLGFKLTKQDTNNRMFVTWLLRKESDVPPAKAAGEGLKWPSLKACVYKRR